MTISAKFKVQTVTVNSGYKSNEVLLVPDYAQGRNKEWAAATPSGTIRMHIGQETEAIKEFTEGRAFTILFEPDHEETGGAMLSGDGVQRVKVTEWSPKPPEYRFTTQGKECASTAITARNAMSTWPDCSRSATRTTPRTWLNWCSI